MKLRDYQQEAHDKLFEWLRTCKGSPVLELPTGAGKSVIIGAILQSLSSINYRSIVLARTKELVEQNASKFGAICPGVSYGIYSAGLSKRDTQPDHIFATVQSVAKKADQFGYRNLIIVDECHQVPAGETTQYQTFLNESKTFNDGVRLCGLTATPYRLDGGPIVGEDQPFDGVAYRKGIGEMVKEGWITKLTNIDGGEVDMSSVKKSYRDFDANQMQEVFCSEVTPHVVSMIECANANARQSCMVFASGVEHASQIHANLLAAGQSAELITGETFSLVREATIAKFKRGDIRWLVNCECLTTGFDAERVDLIAVCRATLSPGLWYQIVGRGMRLAAGKSDCIVLDFGGNVRRHGPLDDPAYGVPKPKKGQSAGDAPKKQCPNCKLEVPAGAAECSCGFRFPPPDRSLESKAETDVAIMSASDTPEQRFEVLDVWYALHEKSGKPTSLRVFYEVRRHDDEDSVQNPVMSQWWCFNHGGYARRVAEDNWAMVSQYEIPENTLDAFEIADMGGCAKPAYIMVKQKGKYPEIRVTADSIEKRPSPMDQQNIYATQQVDDDCPF